MIVFGPVPSRRFGKSLGVNNIPFKHCSYSCIYCQLGTTNSVTIERKEFYNVEEVVHAIKKRLEELKEANEKVDFITFVPDGEPTLDVNLKKIALMLKDLNMKLAIITNSSLIYLPSVQEDLMAFDVVSLKIDAVFEKTFKLINRPHPLLSLEKILEGIRDFTNRFNGKIFTETMLVRGVNDSIDEITSVRDFISTIRVDRSYISIPTRPPAFSWVAPPKEEVVITAFNIFKEKLNTSLLITSEGENFTVLNDAETDLLDILSVHPIEENVIKHLLSERHIDSNVLQKLEEKNLIKKIPYQGKYFYLRRFS